MMTSFCCHVGKKKINQYKKSVFIFMFSEYKMQNVIKIGKSKCLFFNGRVREEGYLSVKEVFRKIF